jgi:hypothetical protein
MAFGAIQQILGQLAITAMEQQNGKLYTAARRVERISRITVAAPGQLDQHIFASMHELLIQDSDVYH